MGAVWKGNRIL